MRCNVSTKHWNWQTQSSNPCSNKLLPRKQQSACPLNACQHSNYRHHWFNCMLCSFNDLSIFFILTKLNCDKNLILLVISIITSPVTMAMITSLWSLAFYLTGPPFPSISFMSSIFHYKYPQIIKGYHCWLFQCVTLHNYWLCTHICWCWCSFCYPIK